MSRLLPVTAAILLLSLSPDSFAAFPLESANGVPSVAPVVRAVTPGVVNVAVHGRERVDNPLLRDPFFRRFFNVPDRPLMRETQAVGSGVIVDAKNGTILTNNHVVEHADQIEVTLTDKRRIKATLVGRDPATDIAVLKIQADNLTAVALGDSDKTEVGDFVLAIGNPFGLGQTVTSGIVSAVARSGLGIEGYEDFVQTDASINPGNSGGALVNLDGKLIGINTAILGPGGGSVGVGFAVPVNMAKSVMQQILQYGHVDRGWIGVGGQDITPDLARGLQIAQGEGAVISAVQPGAPAALAGLKTGDVVVSVDGTPVRSWQQFINHIGLSRIGDQLRITIERQGTESTIPVKVVPRPTQQDQGAQTRDTDPDEP